MRRLLPLLLVAACGGTKPHGAAAPSSSLPPLPPPVHAAYDAPTANASPPMSTSGTDLRLTAIDRKTYEDAQKLFADGRLRDAKRALAKLIVAYPDRAPLIAAFNEIQKRLADAQSVARASLDGHAVVTLAPPPAGYTLAHPAKVDAAPIPKLKLKTRAKNEIVDDEKWYADNGITLPEYFIPPPGDVTFFGVDITITSEDAVTQLSGFGVAEFGPSAQYLAAELPTWLPLSYGTIPLTHAIDSSPYTLAIYGGRLLAVFDETKHARALFDFDGFVHPPANEHGQAKIGSATITAPGESRPPQSFDVTTETNSISHELAWAQVKGQTLFVEHMNREYAKENKGQNAYVTALDLDTGDLAWRSQPLVANAENFALLGGGVVAGYGYTAEPDFLYVLDATTGAVKQKTPVPSGPTAIVPSAGRVFVRTYDTNLSFDVR